MAITNSKLVIAVEEGFRDTPSRCLDDVPQSRERSIDFDGFLHVLARNLRSSGSFKEVLIRALGRFGLGTRDPMGIWVKSFRGYGVG